MSVITILLSFFVIVNDGPTPFHSLANCLTSSSSFTESSIVISPTFLPGWYKCLKKSFCSLFLFSLVSVESSGNPSYSMGSLKQQGAHKFFGCLSGFCTTGKNGLYINGLFDLLLLCSFSSVNSTIRFPF